MKLNNQILGSNFLSPSPKIYMAELTQPLIPIEITPQPASQPDLSLYSHRGFIKGIEVLNEVKKLKYGFSTRRFGNMAFKYGEVGEVVENRKGFIKAAGMNIKNTVFMLPNHGKGIEVVNSSQKGRGAFAPGTSIGPADALITFEKGLALGLNSADCVPLVMTTKNADVLALVHAGRIGTDARIAPEKIRQSLQNYQGIGRRMELIGEINNAKIFSDFAHHPTAIKVATEQIKKQFPDKNIWIIYQPHMFSRTKALFNEFVEVFKKLKS